LAGERGLKKKTRPAKTNRFVQYTLLGALLGLYNGIFYRPSGAADMQIAAELAVLAALATVALRSWKKGYPLRKILKDFAVTTISYMIFLLSLALRQLAMNAGGRALMIAECTLAGALLGLLLAWQWQEDRGSQT
jgi:membrane associated rhomboid family serine protease